MSCETVQGMICVARVLCQSKHQQDSNKATTFNTAHYCTVYRDALLSSATQTPFFSPPWDAAGDAKPPGD